MTVDWSLATVLEDGPLLDILAAAAAGGASRGSEADRAKELQKALTNSGKRNALSRELKGAKVSDRGKA